MNTNKVMRVMISKILKDNIVSIVSFLLAVSIAAIILFILPQEREVKSLGIFLFKLLPFVFASLALASVKRNILTNQYFQYVLIIGSFLLFFTFLVPKIIFHAKVFTELYLVLLITTPYIILCFLLTYRLGGASGSQTFRLSIALLLIMISGVEDLAYFAVNDDPDFAVMPEVWDWVTHIAVRIGHSPTKNEIIASVIIHFSLAIAVLGLPFRRINKMFNQSKFTLLAQD